MTGDRYEQKQAKAWERVKDKSVYALAVLQEYMSTEEWDEMLVTEIRVKLQPKTNDKLVIVKAMKEGQKLVGFHAASDAGEAIRGAMERIENNQMNWREDRPFEG